MRQLTPVANLVLAALAALGLVATLGLPWYAPVDDDPARYDGELEHAAYRVAGVFRDHAGAVTGRDALGDTRMLLAALAGLVLLFAALTAVQVLRPYVRELVRVAGLGLPALVLVRILDRPDALVLHWGVLAALAVAVFAASAAWHGGTIRSRRAPAVAGRQRRPAR